MKKFLLTLTLAGLISSVASAGLVQPIITGLNGQPIDPVSEITINQSDVISFDIISDVQLATLHIIVDVQGEASLDITQLIIPDGWDPVFHMGPIERVPGKTYEFLEGNFFGGPPPGIQLEHILMHCDLGLPNNDVNILVYDPDIFFEPEIGIAIIHQIPEPMTFGLLALGGLALRRRPRQWRQHS